LKAMSVAKWIPIGRANEPDATYAPPSIKPIRNHTDCQNGYRDDIYHRTGTQSHNSQADRYPDGYPEALVVDQPLFLCHNKPLLWSEYMANVRKNSSFSLIHPNGTGVRRRILYHA
jgi:hypothetical protein